MLTKEPEQARNPPRSHHEQPPDKMKVSTLQGGTVFGAHRGSIHNSTAELEVIQSDSESVKSCSRLDTKPLVSDQLRLKPSKNSKSS